MWDRELSHPPGSGLLNKGNGHYLICIYPFHLHYIIRLVAIQCYIPFPSLHSNVLGATHVLKLQVEERGVDMYYSRHLVYFFVLPIGDGWEYHMLKGYKSL